MIQTRADALKVLGFKADANPSPKDIKSAFRKFALKWHPDKSDAPNAKEKFIEITQAVELLSKPRHEQVNMAQSTSGFDADPEELFRQFFSPSFDANTFFDNAFGFGGADIGERFFKSMASSPFKIEYSTKNSHLTQGFEKQDNLYQCLELIFKGKTHLTQFAFSHSEEPHLPEEKVDWIIDSLLKYSRLREARFPEGYLNASQQARLDAHTSAAAKEHKKKQEGFKEKQKRVKKREKNETLISSMLSGLLAFALSYRVGNLLLRSLSHGILASVTFFTYKLYTRLIAGSYYQNEATIKKTPDSEKQALQSGVDALTWKGYFTSFSNRAAWRHPVAFHSGLNHALKENEEMLEAIKPKKK